MGLKMGPNYMCLFVGYVEEQIGQQYTGTVPKLHKRYINNVVGIACCSRVELEEYIAFVSNFQPTLQITHTISKTELPLLDINLRFSGDRIRASIHYKATDTHSCLHYDSSHPCHCKESLPYSQLLCLQRICSDKADTYPCQHPRCCTCGHISCETDFQGPKDCLTIKDFFTCLSSGLIYCISGCGCSAIYIDKTGTLRECFG